MKLSRTPRLHNLLDFRQFTQSGTPSSHFKCLSRHVKHPVRTLLGLDGTTVVTGGTVDPLTSARPPVVSTIIFPVDFDFDPPPDAFNRFAGRGLLPPLRLPLLDNVFD